MAENLYCFVKECNNKDYNDLHICRKHFYKLPKDKRQQLLSMKLVHSIGEIGTDKFFYFIRGLCQLLEPQVVVIVTPKLLSTNPSLPKDWLKRFKSDLGTKNLN